MSENQENNITIVCKHKVGDDEHSHKDGCCTNRLSAESSSFDPHHQVQEKIKTNATLTSDTTCQID